MCMSMCKKLQWKPKDLKKNVEEESMKHKARIVGWSVIMFLIASGYNNFCQMLTYRANMMQMNSLGDNLKSVKSNDYINEHSNEMWQAKNVRDMLDAVSTRDLAYIRNSWKDRDATTRRELAPLSLSVNDWYIACLPGQQAELRRACTVDQTLNQNTLVCDDNILS